METEFRITGHENLTPEEIERILQHPDTDLEAIAASMATGVDLPQAMEIVGVPRLSEDCEPGQCLTPI